MKKNFFGAFVLILGGVIIILGAADVEFPVSFWSIAVALAGLGIMLTARRINAVGMTALLVGAYMTARDIAPGIFPALSFWYIPGVFLVCAGIGMLFGPGHRYIHKVASRPRSDGSQINISTVFSGETLSPQGVCAAGSISAVFGGAEVNLAQVIPENGELVLNVSAIFGGVELYVPGSWKVDRHNAHGIFGGIEIKGAEPAEAQNTLYLEGSAIFGGIDVIRLPGI